MSVADTVLATAVLDLMVKVGFSGPDSMDAGQVSRELLSVER
jgi:hypothetical protein